MVPFDPEHIVTVLARHDVRYVLIGALAALRELDARVYTERPEPLGTMT